MNKSFDKIRTPKELAKAVSEYAFKDNGLSTEIRKKFNDKSTFTSFVEDFLIINKPIFRENQDREDDSKYKNIVEQSFILSEEIHIGDIYNININVRENTLANLKKDLLKAVIIAFRAFTYPEKIHDYIHLPMQTRMKEVTPFTSIEQRNETPKDITNIKIQEVFKEFNGEMLCLGSPGAGKTSLLYELGNSLAAEARLYPKKKYLFCSIYLLGQLLSDMVVGVVKKQMAQY